MTDNGGVLWLPNIWRPSIMEVQINIDNRAKRLLENSALGVGTQKGNIKAPLKAHWKSITH